MAKDQMTQFRPTTTFVKTFIVSKGLFRNDLLFANSSDRSCNVFVLCSTFVPKLRLLNKMSVCIVMVIAA